MQLRDEGKLDSTSQFWATCPGCRSRNPSGQSPQSIICYPHLRTSRRLRYLSHRRRGPAYPGLRARRALSLLQPRLRHPRVARGEAGWPVPGTSGESPHLHPARYARYPGRDRHPLASSRGHWIFALLGRSGLCPTGSAGRRRLSGHGRYLWLHRVHAGRHGEIPAHDAESREASRRKHRPLHRSRRELHPLLYALYQGPGVQPRIPAFYGYNAVDTSIGQDPAPHRRHDRF